MRQGTEKEESRKLQLSPSQVSSFIISVLAFNLQSSKIGNTRLEAEKKKEMTKSKTKSGLGGGGGGITECQRCKPLSGRAPQG